MSNRHPALPAACRTKVARIGPAHKAGSGTNRFARVYTLPDSPPASLPRHLVSEIGLVGARAGAEKACLAKGAFR